MNRKFLIWSFEHDAWWKASLNGYSPDMADAGEYDYETAVKICLDANRNPDKFPNECIIPIP